MSGAKVVKLGAVISYITIVLNIVVGIIYTPWMVGLIGKSDYGLYMLVFAFLSYFLIDFGIGNSIAKFVTNYRIKGEQEKIDQLLGIAAKIYLAIDAVIFAILIFVYFSIDRIFLELSPAEIEKFKMMYLIAGAFSLLSFPFLSLDGVLIAYEKFLALKLCDMFVKLGSVLLIVVCLTLGYGIYALVTVNAIVGLTAIGFKVFYLKKYTSISIKLSGGSRFLIRELLMFSFWISVIGIAQRIMVNLAPFILGRFSGTEQIAIFSIAVVIEGYVWTFAQALNGLFLPKVQSLDLEQDNKEKITDLMIKVGRIQLMIVGLLLIGLIVFGQQFLTLWMGKGFSESYYVMVLLVLPSFITLTQDIAYTYLFVKSKIKFRAIVFIIASIFSFVIALILVPRFGALGSAWGVFVATVLCHIICMNYYYWKKMGIQIPRFFKECYGSLFLPILLTLAIGWFSNRFISNYTVYGFILKIGLTSISYFVLLWYIGMRKEEKIMFSAVPKKILNKIKGGK